MGDWLITETVSFVGDCGKYFEIINGEKTVKEARLGEIWKRCAAYIFDIFLVNLLMFLILISVTLTGDPLADIYGIAFTNLAIFAYFVYFESSRAQATPGKKWMKLRVVDLEGRRISFLRAFFRYFARGMPSIVLVVVDITTNGMDIINDHLGFYFLIPVVTYAPILFMGMRQGVHDVMAGTVVVKRFAYDKE